jgi:hypothetical protein
LVGEPERKRSLEDLGVDGKIILEWMLGNKVGSYRQDASGSREGSMAGCCEHSNESSVFMKGGESLD